MLRIRHIYSEILKNEHFVSSRSGRTEARVILILSLLLKYKCLRRNTIHLLIEHLDSSLQEAGDMGKRSVKTCMERGWIKMKEQKGIREKGTYSITAAGKKMLYQLICERFGEGTATELCAALDSFASDRVAIELSAHKEEEIEAAIKLVLSDYANHFMKLEFEVPNSAEMMRGYAGQEKRKGDVYTDLQITFPCYDQGVRQICIEIDMGTERLGSRGGLLFKCNAYSEVNRRIRQTSLHQAINVVFVCCYKLSGDLRQSDLERFEAMRRYQQPLLPFLSYICRLQNPNGDVTIDGMESALASVKGCNAFGYDGKKFYEDAAFFLRVLKDQCKNHGQAGEEEILSCIADISANCKEHMDTLDLEYSRQCTVERRMELYEGIRAYQSYALSGLRNGMSLSCLSKFDFEKELPFLFPELQYRKQLGILLYHLGIVNEAVSVSSVYSLPLFEEKGVEGIDTVYRCVFMVDDLTVLIENLSSDLGGLIRARDYVRIPPAARPNTIMIMLMNDREELADGSYLKEGSLYRQAGDGSNISERTSMGLALHTKKLAENVFSYESGYHFYNIPYLMNHTQDYIMLHYSELIKALKEPICPWTRMDLYVEEQDKTSYIPFLIRRSGQWLDIDSPLSSLTYRGEIYDPKDWRTLFGND